MMIEVSRVEKHVIKKTHHLFQLIDDYSFRCKNLYNYANYQIRQHFFETGKIIKEFDLSKMCHSADCYKELRSHTAQQVIKMLSKNWKAFRAASRDYKKHPEKYKGKPRIPRYLHKEKGRYVIVFTNQQCKKVNDVIKFPKVFNQFTLPTLMNGKFQQVRIIKRNQHYVIEVVYKTLVPAAKKDNGRFLGIDLGLDNLLTVVSNTGMNPVIINGKGLKSTNQFYNKQKSHYQEIAKRMNNLYSTKRLSRITSKRNQKVDDFLHKASKHIIQLAIINNINTIIIGNNEGWKQEVDLGTKTNQNFVSIPHKRLIDLIKYKASNYGINVTTTEESYTSGTSFLDEEMPVVECYKKSRRIKRGLFKSNTGRLINADVNAAFQIIKKVVPNAFADGIEGVGLHPFKVAIC
jgi:putative transposase